MSARRTLNNAQGEKLRLLTAAVVSSLLSALSQANLVFPYGNPWLGAVSLVPLFWALRTSASPRGAALLLALSLSLTSPLQYYWLASFQDYSLWTIGSVTLGFFLYGLVFGPLVRLALREGGGFGVFLGAATWSLYEFFRSNGYFGFPWGNLPYPFFQWDPLVQGADWGGLPWLSFLIASGMILAVLWMTESMDRTHLPRTTLAYLLLITVHFGYSAWTSEVRPHPADSLNVLTIQQNADPWIRDQELPGLRTSVQLSLEGLAQHPRTDLVVWSENSLRRPLQFRTFYEQTPPERPLFQVLRSSGQLWLFGNPYVADPLGTRVHNAAVLMNSSAEIVDVYGKNHLVPIAEHIPFFEWEPVRTFFQRTVGLYATWIPSDRIRPLTIQREGRPSLELGVQICFEDAFPYISRSLAAQGARAFVVLSNDSWSKTDSAQIQHLIVALFRTIETRRPMIRSTNSGFTGAIDARGKVVAGPLPFFQPGWLHHELVLEEPYPYTPLALAWGDWVGWLFWWVILAYLICRGGRFRFGWCSYSAGRPRWSWSSASGR